MHLQIYLFCSDVCNEAEYHSATGYRHSHIMDAIFITQRINASGRMNNCMYTVEKHLLLGRFCTEGIVCT